MRLRSITIAFLLTLSPAAAQTAFAQQPPPANATSEGRPPSRTPEAFSRLEWRNIGPVNPSGRVADVQGVPGDPRVVWVGAASGGVWKSEDGGLSFKPVFDEQDVHSIGSLGIAPSNPSVVYVGTGEGNPRNSVSPGGGVFKTTDGGKTWSAPSLVETRHVTRVLVHPQNPDVAYVGALGHVFGPNAERGVFKTTDGGQSWKKVLYLDDRHGVADMDMSPLNPNLLYAALWRFERKPWTHTSGSEQGGVWRSSDAGASWTKLTKGLPKLLGRIAVKVAPSNPEIVYVMCESNEGTLYRSDDGGDSFRKITDRREIVSRGLYYTDLRVHPKNPDVVFAVASLLQKSIDGGKTWTRISPQTHIDFHALWIDPLDPERIWQGQDGGVAVTYDGGKRWEPVRNLPLAQFYQAYVDNREPFYFVGGGLQDNGTWYGPSRTREPAGILEDDWRMPSFGDAFFVVAHPKDPDVILSESQGGALYKTDLRTRQQRAVGPQADRNDGGPVAALRYRFNWNSPIVASPHDPETVYFAGNVVFRSNDFGETWQAISPDLTTHDPEKQKDAGGPVWRENTTAEYHCTIISFGESAAQRGVLWAGSDDGNLQLSKDGGKNWTNVIAAVPGLPRHSPVSHVEPSRTAAGTAYAAFDRHMFDDLKPHVFKTADFGKTWTRITNGIADEAYVHVVRQDPKNAKLLWAGTERGLYLSWDEGARWQRTHLKNLPSVPVHDIVFHPRENDVVLATHGRALWVLDDATPLQQLDPTAALEPRLLDVRAGLRFPVRFTRYGLGDKAFRGPNPPAGALISYVLPANLKAEDGDAGAKPKASPRVRLEILDSSGKAVRTLENPPLEKGVNRVAWDLRHDPPRLRKQDDPAQRSEFAPPPAGPFALHGRYTVRLSVDGKRFEAPVEVRVDPLVKTTDAGLREQHEMAATLTTLVSSVNDVLKGLDAMGLQVEERRKAMHALGRELPDDAKQALDAFEKDRKHLLDQLARAENIPTWSEGPRLVEVLSGLFGTIEQAFAAPTLAQRDLFERLRGRVADAMAAYGQLAGERLVKLNEALLRHQLPAFVAPAKPTSD
jgi:photosystem II stability/assembly factor-like uncharacterized protein